MLSENEIKRIYWGCRRGMLEIDLVMVPFFEQRFRQLSEQDQQRFVNLLECEDTELFQWFLGKGQPEDPELASIVADINAFSRQPKV
ncbi:succinate dehydrogenase assembly factor 2 [Spongiibacter sp. KMU-158]|uniref:FAD assembly factor SdhE n=1 Tax=Spongiibacter pelagi TaxID=2760804 RepID=A0A927BZQ6_9GAMM|nr:succinate dehydrogenase assembly factor 2 [Spongiibacter pelagi]MBD2858570.1 succinate dehydrogenase assembly factor 2 [Spongiibacter pelagi]